MIGRITLFILSIFILITLTAGFAAITHRSIKEGHIYDYVTAYSEKISMQGMLPADDHMRLIHRMQDMGNYEIHIKYSRRIAKNIYDITTDLSKIIDRRFGKGDLINILISQNNRVVLNKAVYVMSAGEEYHTGYEVIRYINENYMNISVRNKDQFKPKEYDVYSNPYYGDDEDEKPYNQSYIPEYSRYIKREEYIGDELIKVSFTEQ